MVVEPLILRVKNETPHDVELDIQVEVNRTSSERTVKLNLSRAKALSHHTKKKEVNIKW